MRDLICSGDAKLAWGVLRTQVGDKRQSGRNRVLTTERADVVRRENGSVASVDEGAIGQ